MTSPLQKWTDCLQGLPQLWLTSVSRVGPEVEQWEADLILLWTEHSHSSIVIRTCSRCGKSSGRVSQLPASGLRRVIPTPRGVFVNLSKMGDAGWRYFIVTILSPGGKVCVPIVGSEGLRSGYSGNPVRSVLLVNRSLKILPCLLHPIASECIPVILMAPKVKVVCKYSIMVTKPPALLFQSLFLPASLALIAYLLKSSCARQESDLVCLPYTFECHKNHLLIKSIAVQGVLILPGVNARRLVLTNTLWRISWFFFSCSWVWDWP